MPCALGVWTFKKFRKGVKGIENSGVVSLDAIERRGGISAKDIIVDRAGYLCHMALCDEGRVYSDVA